MINIKYHILIVSLILSSLLWLSLNLDQTYEIERNVPIKINVEKPYAISNIIPLNLDVKLRGKGWSLIRLFTSLKLDFHYQLNYNGNDKYSIFTKQYLNDYEGLGQGLNITYVKPETLVVKLDRYEEKYVKLIPKVNIICKEGYQTVGRPIVEPESIKVGGSSLILSKLASLNLNEVKYDGVNANINDRVNLSDSLSNIIWLSREVADIHIKIELTAEKEYQNIEIRIPNLPNDKDVLLIPQYLTVHLKGGVKQLSELDNNKIFALIDYNEILNDTTGAVIPRFILPEGMNVIQYKPDRIQYVIKKKF